MMRRAFESESVTRYYGRAPARAEWVELAPDQFSCYVNQQMPRTRRRGSFNDVYSHVVPGPEPSGLELIFTRYFTRYECFACLHQQCTCASLWHGRKADDCRGGAEDRSRRARPHALTTDHGGDELAALWFCKTFSACH